MTILAHWLVVLVAVTLCMVWDASALPPDFDEQFKRCEANLNTRNKELMEWNKTGGWAFSTNETLYRHSLQFNEDLNSRVCDDDPNREYNMLPPRSGWLNYCVIKKLFNEVHQYVATDSGENEALTQLIQKIVGFVQSPINLYQLERFDFNEFVQKLPLCYGAYDPADEGLPSLFEGGSCGDNLEFTVSPRAYLPFFMLAEMTTRNTLNEIFDVMLAHYKRMCDNNKVRIIRPYNMSEVHNINPELVRNDFDDDPRLGSMLVFRKGKTYTVIATSIDNSVSLCLVDHESAAIPFEGSPNVRWSKYVLGHMGEYDTVVAPGERYRRNRFGWYFGYDGDLSVNHPDRYEELRNKSRGAFMYGDKAGESIYIEKLAAPKRTLVSDYRFATAADIFNEYGGIITREPYLRYSPFGNQMTRPHVSYKDLNWTSVDLTNMPAHVEGFYVCGCFNSPSSRIEIINGEVSCVEGRNECVDGSHKCPENTVCEKPNRLGYFCRAKKGFSFNWDTNQQVTEFIDFYDGQMNESFSIPNATHAGTAFQVFSSKDRAKLTISASTVRPYIAPPPYSLPLLSPQFYCYSVPRRVVSCWWFIFIPICNTNTFYDTVCRRSVNVANRHITSTFGGSLPGVFEHLPLGFAANTASNVFEFVVSAIQFRTNFHDVVSRFPEEPDTSARGVIFYRITFYAMENRGLPTQREVRAGPVYLAKMQSTKYLEVVTTDVLGTNLDPGTNMVAAIEQINPPSNRIPRSCWLYFHLDTRRSDPLFPVVKDNFLINSAVSSVPENHGRFASIEDGIRACKEMKRLYDRKWSGDVIQALSEVDATQLQTSAKSIATVRISFSLSCGCSSFIFDPLLNNGGPTNFNATLERTKVRVRWADSSRCKNRYAFSRIDADKFYDNPEIRRPPHPKNLTTFTRDYYAEQNNCDAIYDPQDELFDDATRFSVGQRLWYCAAAKSPETRTRGAYESRLGCNDEFLTIRFLSQINVRVVLPAGNIGSPGVDIIYRIGLPMPGQKGVVILLQEGSATTDIRGDAVLEIDVDPEDYPNIRGLNSLVVLMYFYKTSGGGDVPAIEHSFLCGSGTRNCTDAEPERVDVRHMVFDHQAVVVDNTTVPIRGQVFIKNTNCPLGGAQLCLYMNGSTTPVGSCTNSSDVDGSFLLFGPIGSVLIPTGTFNTMNLTTPNKSIALDALATVKNVLFFYEEEEDLYVQLTGTECGFELVQDASLTLERPGCSISKPLQRIEGGEGTLFRLSGKAPALNFEVKVSGPVMFVNASQPLSGSTLQFFLDRTNENGAPHDINLLAASSFPNTTTSTVFVAGIDLNYLSPRLVRFAFNPDPELSTDFLQFPNGTFPHPSTWSQYVFEPTLPTGCSSPAGCFKVGAVDTADGLGVRFSTKVYLPEIDKTCHKASPDWRAFVTNQLGVRGGANFTGACYDGCALPLNPETGEAFFAFKAIPTYFQDVIGLNNSKPFEVGLALNLASSLLSERKYCFIVTGTIPNDDVGNSVPLTNFKPLTVLRDPPGSLSYSHTTYQKTSLYMRVEGLNVRQKTGDWMKHELGVFGDIGVCFGVNFFFVTQDTCMPILETSYTFNHGDLPAKMTESETVTKSTNRTGVSLTWTYSMETDSSNDNHPGPSSDMFFVPSLTMRFTKVDIVELNSLTCTKLRSKFEYDIDPQSPQSKAGMTWISRRDVDARVLPTLAAMYEQETNVTGRRILENAIQSWKNATAMLPPQFKRRKMVRPSDFRRIPNLLEKFPVDSLHANPEHIEQDMTETKRTGIATDSDPNGLHSITFVGGGSLFSYEIEQQTGAKSVEGVRNYRLETDSSQSEMEIGILLVQYANEQETSTELESVLEISFETETTQTSISGFVLGDSTVGDEFTVDIYDDLQLGGFYFDLVAGRSACPYEPGTIARENPRISVVETQSGALHPEEDAQYKVTVSNLGDAPWGVEIFTDMKSFGADDLDLLLNGVSFTARPFVIETMNPGSSSDFLLTMKRGSKFDYYNIPVGVRSWCESSAFLGVGIYQASQIVQHKTTIAPQFMQLCPRIELVGPLAAALMDGQTLYLNAAVPTLSLELKNVEGISTNTSWAEMATSRGLEKVRFEYRTNLPGAPWVQLTSNQAPFDVVDFISLEQYPSRVASYVWNITNTVDTEFSIRAVAECHSNALLAQLDARLSSFITPSLTVRVDRIPPRMFYFFPAMNANYFPEKSITATFSEPIRCRRISTSDSPLEVQMIVSGVTTPMNLTSANDELLLRCSGEKLEVEVNRMLVPVRLLLGGDVRIVIKNVVDLAGNPLRTFPATGSSDYVSAFTYAKVDLSAAAFKVTGLILPSTVVTSEDAPRGEIEANVTEYVAISLGNINPNRIRMNDFHFVDNIGLVVDLTILPQDATFAPVAAPTPGRRRRQLDSNDVASGIKDAVDNTAFLGFASGGNVDVILSPRDLNSNSNQGDGNSVITMAVNSESQILLGVMDSLKANFSSVSGASSSQLLQTLDSMRARLETALSELETNVTTSVNASVSVVTATTGNGQGGNNDSSSSAGAIAGAAIGGIIASGLIVGLVAYSLHKRRLEEKVKETNRHHSRTGDIAYNAYNANYTPNPVFRQEEGHLSTVSLGGAGSDATSLVPSMASAENPSFEQDRHSKTIPRNVDV